MKQAVMDDFIRFGEFVFIHECKDFADVYVCALAVLGETAKDQWTQRDVVEAVFRAIRLMEKGRKKKS